MERYGDLYLHSGTIFIILAETKQSSCALSVDMICSKRVFSSPGKQLFLMMFQLFGVERTGAFVHIKK